MANDPNQWEGGIVPTETVLPLMTRDEFDVRFEAIRREESRRWMAVFLCVFGSVSPVALLAILWRTSPPWLSTLGFLALVIAIIVSMVFMERFFRRRPARFGLVCPHCQAPLRGFISITRYTYVECPACKKWMSVL